MSQWTHFAGCIRWDSIPALGDTFDPVAVLGPMEDWDSPADITGVTLPSGSEGSLKYHVWQNPHGDHAAQFSVQIFGDLRDYGEAEDIERAMAWFKQTCSVGMLRGAVLAIDVEYGDTIVLTAHWDSGGAIVNKAVFPRCYGEADA